MRAGSTLRDLAHRRQMLPTAETMERLEAFLIRALKTNQWKTARAAVHRWWVLHEAGAPCDPAKCDPMTRIRDQLDQAAADGFKRLADLPPVEGRSSSSCTRQVHDDLDGHQTR